MNKKIGFVIIVIIIGIIVYFTFGRGAQEDIATTVNNDTIEDIKESNSLQNEEKGVDDTADLDKGSYQSYSEEKIALAETGKVVIFFHASWCPSCKALNNDIENNLASIPAGVIILKADYDKETELKKKYGVTTQHTLVQVDKDGGLIKKWSGGSKLENIISQIN